MPNIATLLKAEISRLAKKESKLATSQLKRASAQYRRDIAALKRLLDQQERVVAQLTRKLHGPLPEVTAAEAEDVRFSARSVKAQRRRLGLSAKDYGRLVGVSGLTVYSWESGKSRPRRAQMAALIAARKLGKRQALAQLMQSAPRKVGKPR